MHLDYIINFSRSDVTLESDVGAALLSVRVISSYASLMFKSNVKTEVNVNVLYSGTNNNICVNYKNF